MIFKHTRQYYLTRIRRYFFSGLLVWIPIWVTIIVIKFLVDILDSILLLLPERFRPDAIFGIHIPGIGVLIILTVIFLTGLFVANYMGRQLVVIWDASVNRIPLVRTVHAGVKQVLETLFTPGGQSFRKVLLVEYPYKGIWSLAFQTGDGTPEVNTLIKKDEMISVFIPMTPNITSGFLLMVPADKVIPLEMTVDQALKFVISLGVMQPVTPEEKK